MAKRKSTAENQPANPATFEESLNELQSIVHNLEDGSLGLETSLAQFERGVNLLRACYSILESAEQRVEVLTRFDGSTSPDAESQKTMPSSDQPDNLMNGPQSDLPTNNSSSTEFDGDRTSLF